MAAGERFPPLVVFEEGDRFWLAEGFHRLGGAQAAGLAEVECDVRPGGLREAILQSVGSNAVHGLRRSNADKRRAVSILLKDELVAVDPGTGDRWSDQEVSRRCAVSPTFVGTVRRSLSTVDSEPAPRAYRDRHGNVSQMDTARIGRKPADHASPAADMAPADPAPVELAAQDQLADALARQFRHEAEQLRGPCAAEGVAASNVVALRRPDSPAPPDGRLSDTELDEPAAEPEPAREAVAGQPVATLAHAVIASAFTYFGFVVVRGWR